ncbi:EAL domain-containing protein [Acidaminobacter sp. JC074]|uniref:EAL domain-containing protein n=1 Tax=Acidaminobacter sp. JC074 TaxID=2530199 RepID=UPI001F10E958|nr:EAL domain-containing protein [Acidaminobacter sp. JC074]MCH4887074.1 EAL domain-containing protein [Acidaminobacter sp. JC074]
MQKRRVIKQLNILAIIVIAAFLFFAVIYSTFVNRRLQETVDSRMYNEVNVISQEVNLFFAEHAAIVDQMRNNQILIDYVKLTESQGVKNDLYNDFLKTVQNIRHSADQTSLVWVGLIKENDVISDIEDYKTKPDYNILDRPWYKEMIHDGSPLVFTSPYEDTSTDEMVVSIVAPIYDNGRLIGNLGIDISLSKLVDFISDYSTDQSGHAMLLSEDKTYVVAPRVDLGDHIHELEGDQGLFKFSIEKDYHLSYKRIDKNDWMVAFIILEEEVTYSTKLFKGLSIFIFIVAMIMIGIFILLIRMSDNFDELSALYAKLTKKEQALKQSNETTLSAFEQLKASEEELRAQYDEIQDYLKRIEELKEKYDLAVELTHISVWEYDIKDQTIVYNNAYFTDDRSIEGMQLPIYDSLEKILETSSFNKIKNAMLDYLDGKTDELFCQISRDGYWYLVLGRTTIEGKVNGIIMDVTKMKKQEIALSEMANMDPLTGLPNRRNFKLKLKELLDRHDSGAVILLDLDNFKEINDTLGHVFGDAVLETIAGRLKELACEDIYVSRFGGDEFLIQVSGKCDLSQAIHQIIKSVNEKMIIDDEHIVITMSMGITKYPKDGHTVDELIMNADLAMYSVKKSGRNSFAFYTTHMKESLKARSYIEKELHKALENDDFKVLYQPQYDSISGQVVSYEALLRMKDSELSPGKFIPVAEDSGMIIPIGQWVIREVVRQVSTWEKPILKPVAVNFSVKQIHDKDFIPVLEEALRTYKVDPKNIEIEITESVFFEDKKETIKFMKKLKSMGHSIALDDFGTGYSSLNYLTYLPLDKLKLDKSLMDKFLSTHEAFISHIIELAHSIDLKVVAEGIETKEQYDKLRQVNCDVIQGYYFSKPLEIEEIKKLNT